MYTNLSRVSPFKKAFSNRIYKDTGSFVGNDKRTLYNYTRYTYFE